MYQSRAKYLLIVLFILWESGAYAQTTASSGSNTSNPLSERENNPYSKYGIGELWNGNDATLKGMGSITSAYENPYEINSDNPASYAFLQRTTFEAGATASIRTINGSVDGVGTSFTTGTMSLAYLSLGIPVNKHCGLSLGFKPYSKVYYNLADTNQSSPIGQAVNSYSGQGALSFAYVGAGFKFGDFSFGANVGYMFGTINSTTATVPIDTNTYNRANTAEFTNSDRIGGIYWKGGAMYEHKVDSDYTIRIGATITLQQNISERQTPTQTSSYNFGDTLVNDTTYNPGTLRGKLTLPMSYSVGIMLVKNSQWQAGIDYTATQWSGFRSTPDATMQVGVGNQSYRIAAGGEFTPDITNFRNYFSRVSYRVGLYYGNDYLDLANTQLPYYGITLGGSLPFRRTTSRLSMALDIGSIGTVSNGLLQETYVRFTLGFSFNDRWFIPRKYD
jgi:long-subunit fatty acid transport protein